MILRAVALLFAVSLGLAPLHAPAQSSTLVDRVAHLSNGISLHYEEKGTGEPVIFVHGSLSDYTYWDDEVRAFSTKYRAIAYSRRYDFPNSNPSRAGYSAIGDADDLALFIRTLGIKRANIVGHSYGALTALILAIQHPEVVKSVVLAEPPAISLLRDVQGPIHQLGVTQYSDMQQRLIHPMKQAFDENNTDAGIGIFMTYMFNNPKAWKAMSADTRAAEFRNAREWQVIMTRGTLLPSVSPDAVHAISAPVLLMGGTSTSAFLISVLLDLQQLLPNAKTLWVPGAGHQMWYQNPELCRETTEEFFAHVR